MDNRVKTIVNDIKNKLERSIRVSEELQQLSIEIILKMSRGGTRRAPSRGRTAAQQQALMPPPPQPAAAVAQPPAQALHQRSYTPRSANPRRSTVPSTAPFNIAVVREHSAKIIAAGRRLAENQVTMYRGMQKAGRYFENIAANMTKIDTNTQEGVDILRQLMILSQEASRIEEETILLRNEIRVLRGLDEEVLREVFPTLAQTLLSYLVQWYTVSNLPSINTSYSEQLSSRQAYPKLSWYQYFFGDTNPKPLVTMEHAKEFEQMPEFIVWFQLGYVTQMVLTYFIFNMLPPLYNWMKGELTAREARKEAFQGIIEPIEKFRQFSNSETFRYLADKGKHATKALQVARNERALGNVERQMETINNEIDNNYQSLSKAEKDSLEKRIIERAKSLTEAQGQQQGQGYHVRKLAGGYFIAGNAKIRGRYPKLHPKPFSTRQEAIAKLRAFLRRKS